jgi:hypothetical protein
MTAKLKQAFDQAAKLPEAEQDLVASWLLAELAADDEFDRKITATAGKLAGLARDALAELHSGKTEELDPERI